MDGWKYEKRIDLSRDRLLGSRMAVSYRDDRANLIVIHVCNNGSSVDLTNYSATVAILRSDHTTVIETGSIVGSTVNIELPLSAYNVLGITRCSVILNNLMTGQRVTIALLTLDVIETATNALPPSEKLVIIGDEELKTDATSFSGAINEIYDGYHASNILVGDLERIVGQLSRKVDGYLYDFIEDTERSFEKVIPVNALKYAFLDKVGAESLMWNQFAENTTSKTKRYIKGATMRSGDKIYIHYELNASPTGSTIMGLSIMKADGVNNSTMARLDIERNATNLKKSGIIALGEEFGIGISDGTNNSTVKNNIWSYTMGTSQNPDIVFSNVMVINLTTMFGAGNEPTVEEFEQMFPAEYYEQCAPVLRNYEPTKVVCIGADEYVGKTIDLSEVIAKYFPDGMKSVRDVYDEIDIENGKAIKRIGKVVIDQNIIDTFAQQTSSSSQGIPYKFYRTEGTAGSNILPNVTSGYTLRMIIDRPLRASYANKVYLESSEAGLICSNAYGRICISLESYASLDELKTDLLGATIYYEYMDESNVPHPIVTDITETLDRDLVVSVGGLIRFENSQLAKVPIPNSETFMIRL